MSGKAVKKRWITSGDKLTDWIFSRIIHALNHKIEAIYLKEFLREKYRGKATEFCGYIDDGVIFLSASGKWHRDRRAIAKTLLHEVMHNIFCCVHERNILRLEDLVWEKLSDKQIDILKSYVPRHIVKNSHTA